LQNPFGPDLGQHFAFGERARESESERKGNEGVGHLNGKIENLNAPKMVDKRHEFKCCKIFAGKRLKRTHTHSQHVNVCVCVHVSVYRVE